MSALGDGNRQPPGASNRAFAVARQSSQQHAGGAPVHTSAFAGPGYGKRVRPERLSVLRRALFPAARQQPQPQPSPPSACPTAAAPPRRPTSGGRASLHAARAPPAESAVNGIRAPFARGVTRLAGLRAGEITKQAGAGACTHARARPTRPGLRDFHARIRRTAHRGPAAHRTRGRPHSRMLRAEMCLAGAKGRSHSPGRCGRARDWLGALGAMFQACAGARVFDAGS